MKMKLICIGGVSAIGKTYERTHNPEYKDLPYVDIAEIYDEFPGIHYDSAWELFEDRILEKLDHLHAVVVAEAAFTDRQQMKIGYFAFKFGLQLKLVMLPTPSKKVLLERIEQDQFTDYQRGIDPVKVKARYEMRKAYVESTVKE